MEIAETTVDFDLQAKAPRYLAAGIPEVWVIDVVREVVHVHRGGMTTQLRAGDSLSPLAFPDIVLEVAAILP